ncbi:MAG: hypothetical protein V3Q69_11270 [Burkholderia sp.]
MRVNVNGFRSIYAKTPIVDAMASACSIYAKSSSLSKAYVFLINMQQRLGIEYSASLDSHH